MKKYNTPELTLCNFSTADVITDFITLSGLGGFEVVDTEFPDYEGGEFDV